jgi:hypothetical protein
MILISSNSISKNDVVNAYYQRQAVEQIFGFSKDDLGIFPIRNHNNKTVKGYLKKLKCKVFGTQIIPMEPVREVRQIFEQFQLLVPKSLGI